MSAKKSVSLVGPDGREYSTTDRTEVVNLRARGYKVKAAPAPANKAVQTVENKSEKRA